MNKFLILFSVLISIQQIASVLRDKRATDSLSNDIYIDAPKNRIFKIDSNSRDTLFDDELYVILLPFLHEKLLNAVKDFQARNKRDGNVHRVFHHVNPEEIESLLNVISNNIGEYQSRNEIKWPFDAEQMFEMYEILMNTLKSFAEKSFNHKLNENRYVETKVHNNPTYLNVQESEEIRKDLRVPEFSKGHNLDGKESIHHSLGKNIIDTLSHSSQSIFKSLADKLTPRQKNSRFNQPFYNEEKYDYLFSPNSYDTIYKDFGFRTQYNIQENFPRQLQDASNNNQQFITPKDMQMKPPLSLDTEHLSVPLPTQKLYFGKTSSDFYQRPLSYQNNPNSLETVRIDIKLLYPPPNTLENVPKLPPIDLVKNLPDNSTKLFFPPSENIPKLLELLMQKDEIMNKASLNNIPPIQANLDSSIPTPESSVTIPNLELAMKKDEIKKEILLNNIPPIQANLDSSHPTPESSENLPDPVLSIIDSNQLELNKTSSSLNITENSHKRSVRFLNNHLVKN